MNAGVHTMTAADYHADQVADEPSLSASIAHTLISGSPAHARAAHPKLNPHLVRDEAERYDIGTAAHRIILEGHADNIQIVYADDWRTNAAKELRDEARSNGQLPLLEKVWDEVSAMTEAALWQLAGHEAQPPLFTDGKPEQSLVWDEGGVTCRARLDWLRDDHTAIDDLKTTSRSANPEAFSRHLFGIGSDVQAAFYLRGLEALTGVDAEFRFVVVETAAPYALSVVSLGPAVMALANAKVDWAIRKWRECLAADNWPAYPNSVCWAELPAWEEARFLARFEGELPSPLVDEWADDSVPF